MPAISVIIPTYNHREYIMEALDSVFAQTFHDFEVIVVNDGSPDDTDAVLEPLIAAGRIRYFEQPNAGQAAARNRGLHEATGEFVAFLDDDDAWPADHLHWLVEELKGSPEGVLAYGSCQIMSSGGTDVVPLEASSGNTIDDFIPNRIFSPGQTLIRKNALDAVGGLDASIWGSDDWDLYLRLARRGPFVFSGRLALFYRNHSANASKDFCRMYKNGRVVVFRHFGGSSAVDRRRRKRAIRCLKQYAAVSARPVIAGHVRSGRYVAAASAFARLLCISPGILFSMRIFLRIARRVPLRGIK